MHICIQDNVRDFNTKLLGGRSHGDSAAAAHAAAQSGKADWCVAHAHTHMHTYAYAQSGKADWCVAARSLEWHSCMHA